MASFFLILQHQFSHFPPTSEMAAAATCVERFLFLFLFIGENEGRVCVSMMLGGLDRA